MGERKKLTEREKQIKKDFDKIKDLYGEDFAKICRDKLGVILEKAGELPRLIQEHFAPSKAWSERLDKNRMADVGAFVEFMLFEFYKDKINQQNYPDGIETPEELFDKAGYNLYKCNTVEDMRKFEKYYATNELICTFRGPSSRLNGNHIFWAVKKDVDNIKREDFINPQREDEYSTSVMSLQFTRLKNFLAIISRYNHSVPCPNSTYSNMLDEIQEGLTYSFEKHYGIKQSFDKSREFRVGESIVASDNRMYLYNQYMGGCYYCNNNIIINANCIGRGKVEEYNKARYEVFDVYILDKKEKRIFMHPSVKQEGRDTTLENLEIEKVDVISVKGTSDRIIKILASPNNEIEIKINIQGQMIEFYSSALEHAGNHFLELSRNLRKFVAPKLKTIGEFSLRHLTSLEEIEVPQLEKVGMFTLAHLGKVREIKLDNLKETDANFLGYAPYLEKLDLPMLEILGRESVCQCERLREFRAPKITKLAGGVLQEVSSLTVFDAPNVEAIERYALHQASSLRELYLPKLKTIDDEGLRYAPRLEKLYTPNLEKVGRWSMCNLNSIEELDLPNLKSVEDYWLGEAKKLRRLYLPKLEVLPDLSLGYVDNLEEVSAENLREIGTKTLYNAPSLTTLNLPKLKKVDKESLESMPKIKELVFPILKEIPLEFCRNAESVERVILPSVEFMPEKAFNNCPNLKKLYAPNIYQLIGSNFSNCENLEEMTLTNIKVMGDNCFKTANKLTSLNLPNLKMMGNDCFYTCESLAEINLPNLLTAENNVFNQTADYGSFRADNLKRVGTYFLGQAHTFENCFAPNLREYEKGFLGIVSRGYGDVGKFILPKEVKEVLIEAKAKRNKEFNEWLNSSLQKAKQTSEATEVKAPEKQERVVKKVPFVRKTTREQMQETLDELEEQDNPNRRPQEKRRPSLLSQIFERRERRELERQIEAERDRLRQEEFRNTLRLEQQIEAEMDRLRQEEFRNTLRNDITTPTSLNQTAVGNKTKEKPKSKEREK